MSAKNRRGPLCMHCGSTKRIYARGLCEKCHKTPGVRERYTPVSGKVGGGRKAQRDEPTMEELDAMIAERMKDLPAWWYKSEELQDAVN